MKVDAVSSVNYGNKTNYGLKNARISPTFTENSLNTSDLAKVPVIVMLAMNPATLNSTIPMGPESEVANKIEALAPASKSLDASTYVLSPITDEVEQSGKDFVVPAGNLMYVQNFDYFGHKYNVVYSSTSDSHYDDISNIYFYKDGEKVTPAKMYGLVYHEDPATGKNFYGAIILKEFIKNNKRIGAVESEIELPSYISDFIIKVLNDETKFINNLTTIDLYKSKSLRLKHTRTIKYD